MHKNFSGIYVNRQDPADQRQYDASYEVTGGKAMWSAIVRGDGTSVRGEIVLLDEDKGDIERAVALAIGGALGATAGH